MSPDHVARLRRLPADKRERVCERACLIHEAEGGRLTWEQADERAWDLEVNGKQPALPGVAA